MPSEKPLKCTENSWNELTKMWKDEEISRIMCNEKFRDSNEKPAYLPQINIQKNQQVQLEGFANFKFFKISISGEKKKLKYYFPIFEGDNAIVQAQVKIPLDLLDTSQAEIQGVPNQILELQKDLLLGFPRTTAISFKYLYDCPPISDITVNECEVNQYQVDIHKPQKPVRKIMPEKNRSSSH